MSAPSPRRKPRGKPLPDSDDALDKAATVSVDDVPDARSWWARGQRGKLADLLDATDDEDAL